MFGFWNDNSSFKGVICDGGDMRQVKIHAKLKLLKKNINSKKKPIKVITMCIQIVCTENLAVGIDQNGKLKKLSTSCPTSDLNCSLTTTSWEDVLVDSSNSDNVKCENQVQKTLKFIKVASNQHCIVAVDEFGTCTFFSFLNCYFISLDCPANL